MDRRIIRWLSESSALEGEPIPGQSLVEVAGDQSVLVENHQGITQYSPEKISIRVSYGVVTITGCCLEVRTMTRERLVVRGRIACVQLERRRPR